RCSASFPPLDRCLEIVVARPDSGKRYSKEFSHRGKNEQFGWMAPSLAAYDPSTPPPGGPHDSQPLATAIMTTGMPQIELVAPWRIGVDVGGTFTDLVMVDREGSIHVVKVPSTPSDPSKGVLAAVARAARDLGLSDHDLLSD